MDSVSKMPVLYLGHGAPTLLEDPTWTSELANLAQQIKRPRGIVIVSAHWESAPATIGATDAGVPLIYDFGGFDPKYYRLQYQTPAAKELGARVLGLLGRGAVEQPSRGLDHGAYIPLMVMYPEADIPVVQVSLPTQDPDALVKMGEALAQLRDEDILVIGSGFLTHGLPFLRDWRAEAVPPGWSVDFANWARDAITRGAIDELADFRQKAPGMPYAHPTVDHFLPLFVTLGAGTEPAQLPIDGYWYGLAKTSVRLG